MAKSWRVLFLGLLVLSFSAFAEIPGFANLDQIVQQLQLTKFKGKPFKKRVKIAILDNGFNGWEEEKGKGLPGDVVYHPGKETAADADPNMSYHGLLMAKLLNQLIVKSGVGADYELHLYNSAGYYKFEEAVSSVITKEFDLVVHSQIWQHSGNGDGKGFINTLVDRATAAGIIWINSAGNFGKLTRTAPVDGKVSGDAEWVHFAGKKTSGDTVKLICNPKVNEKCLLQAYLTWNDFRNEVKTGTEKDLDLFIYDKDGKQLGSGEKRQVLPKDKDTVANASLLPVELVELEIPKGTYTAKVKIVSKNFSASQDKMNLLIAGSFMEMEDPDTGETLMPPAENQNVIAIGAADFDGTSESKILKRPEISLISLVNLEDKSTFFGTSTAAAMAGAYTAIQIGLQLATTRDQVLNALKKIHKKPLKDLPPPPVPQNRPPPQESDKCLTAMDLPAKYPEAKKLLAKGPSVPIILKGRPAIAVKFDLGKYFNLRNLDEDQFVFMTPQGLVFLGPERLHEQLPLEFYQVIPWKKPLCNGEK